MLNTKEEIVQIEGKIYIYINIYLGLPISPIDRSTDAIGSSALWILF